MIHEIILDKKCPVNKCCDPCTFRLLTLVWAMSLREETHYWRIRREHRRSPPLRHWERRTITSVARCLDYYTMQYNNTVARLLDYIQGSYIIIQYNTTIRKLLYRKNSQEIQAQWRDKSKSFGKLKLWHTFTYVHTWLRKFNNGRCLFPCS